MLLVHKAISTRFVHDVIISILVFTSNTFYITFLTYIIPCLLKRPSYYIIILYPQYRLHLFYTKS